MFIKTNIVRFRRDNMTEVLELRKKTGMKQKEFAEYFGIPLRNIQFWEYGQRKPPEYVIAMMKRILENEFFNKQKQ